MTFQYFLLQQTFNNDTLMTKLANIKNQINHRSKCTWFGTLCSMVSFYVHLNTNILFYRCRDFITWPMSYVLVLKFQWIRSQHIMGTWFSETVIFLGSFKQLCIITTQKNLGTFCSDNVIVYYGNLKGLGIFINQQNMVTWWSDTMIVYYGSFKRLSIVTTQQNLGPWCIDTIIVFPRFSKYRASSSTEIFDINMYFVYESYTG